MQGGLPIHRTFRERGIDTGRAIPRFFGYRHRACISKAIRRCRMFGIPPRSPVLVGRYKQILSMRSLSVDLRDQVGAHRKRRSRHWSIEALHSSLLHKTRFTRVLIVHQCPEAGSQRSDTKKSSRAGLRRQVINLLENETHASRFYLAFMRVQGPSENHEAPAWQLRPAQLQRLEIQWGPCTGEHSGLLRSLRSFHVIFVPVTPSDCECRGPNVIDHRSSGSRELRPSASKQCLDASMPNYFIDYRMIDRAHIPPVQLNGIQ